LGLFLAPQARAQFTQVTATVKDPSGIPYADGTVSAVLTPGSSTGSFSLNGNPYSGQIGPASLDSTGSFVLNFGSNTAIVPAGTKWAITVNSNPGGIPLPFGTGAQSFTVTMTISGSTENISSTLNAAAPALTNFAAGGGSISACIAAGGIAYENGTSNALTCTGNATTNSSGEITVPGGIVGGGLALYPSNYSGADHCIQINNAMKAAVNGQIADDSATNGGVYPCTVNPWAGVPDTVHLKLGCGANYNAAVPWVMSNGSHLIGCAVNNAATYESTVQAVQDGSWSGSAVIVMGTSSNSDSQVSQVNINCAGVAGVTGIYTQYANSYTSWIRDAEIADCPIIGVDVEGQSTEGFSLQNVSIIPESAAVSSTLGLKVFNTFDIGITNVSVDGTASYPMTTCMDLDEFAGVVINIETEQCTNGVLMNSTGTVGKGFGLTLVKATGGLNTTNTFTFGSNANSSAVSYNLFSVTNGTSGNTAISDPIFGSYTLLNNVAEYQINETATGAGNFFIHCIAFTPCNSTYPQNLSASSLSSTVATGTPPISVTSTTTVPNLTVSNHPKVQYCGTTSSCGHSGETSAQIVYGSAALVSGTPSTVTITGISPAFTSTSDYFCTVTGQSAATSSLYSVTNISTSSFTITGPATVTTVVNYLCTGF
jgi:hypothetical protein